MAEKMIRSRENRLHAKSMVRFLLLAISFHKNAIVIIECEYSLTKKWSVILHYSLARATEMY